jgi:hypothetical protein
LAATGIFQWKTTKPLNFLYVTIFNRVYLESAFYVSTKRFTVRAIEVIRSVGQTLKLIAQLQIWLHALVSGHNLFISKTIIVGIDGCAVTERTTFTASPIFTRRRRRLLYELVKSYAIALRISL